MAIPTGNAKVTFSYGESEFVLPFCTITSYDQQPEYAADSVTVAGMAISFSGTCVFGDAAPPDLYVALKDLSLKGPGQVSNVVVEVDDEEVYYLPRDAKRGPLMSVTITEIIGLRAAVATFTINAVVSNRSSAYTQQASYAPVAHTWTQSFALDSGGLLTRTVRGTLTIDMGVVGGDYEPAADGSSAAIEPIAALADLFRKSIMPFVPEGTIWRRESQTFTVNELGNQLTYEITDSQARVQLPDGAYSGTADFHYERKRSSLALAICRFECELEGPVDGDVRRLIWGAVVLSQSRIRFDQCLISRMTVQEMEMLKRSKIRFELEVEALATAVDLNAPGATTIAVPMAQYIGKNFTMSRTCSQFIDPYGPDTGSYFMFGPGGTMPLSAKDDPPDQMPIAAIEAFVREACTPETPALTIVAPQIAIDTINAIMNIGPFKSQQEIKVGGTESPQSTTRPIETVEACSSFTHVNTKTRMHRLQTVYTEGADFVFQTGKPVVMISERMEVKRINLPPARVMRPMPAGFVMVEDDWRTNFGAIDSNGNRTFTGVYTRTLMAYDGGGATSNGYATANGFRTWWSPSAEVQPALALGYGEDMQATSNSVLAASTTGQGYPLGTRPGYA